MVYLGSSCLAFSDTQHSNFTQVLSPWRKTSRYTRLARNHGEDMLPLGLGQVRMLSLVVHQPPPRGTACNPPLLILKALAPAHIKLRRMSETVASASPSTPCGQRRDR